MDPSVPHTCPVDLGTAELLPDLDRPGGYLLLVDAAAQSYVDLTDPTYLEFEYVRRIGHLIDLLPERARIVHLGGGAFTLPRYAAAVRPQADQLVVEADAALVRMIREFLPFDERIEVTIGDARDLTEAQPPESVDLLIGDVFGAGDVPDRVVSLEFLAQAARACSRTGVYVANIADRAPFAFARRFAAGMQRAFPHAALVAEPSVLRGRRYGNILVAGSPAPLPIPALAARLAADPFPARVQEVAGFVDGAAPLVDDGPVPSPGLPSDAFTVE